MGGYLDTPSVVVLSGMRVLVAYDVMNHIHKVWDHSSAMAIGSVPYLTI
jgi:hypothetical protein